MNVFRLTNNVISYIVVTKSLIGPFITPVHLIL